MKVTYSAMTRFHIFDLARQIDQMGHLERLFTGVPKWQIPEPLKRKASSMPWVIGPVLMGERYGFRSHKAIVRAAIIHNRWVERNLGPCDIYHSLSDQGGLSAKIARERYGALTICDRPAAHILFHENNTREEAARVGVAYNRSDPRLIDLELRAYDLADLIIVPSEFVRRTFIEHGVPAAKLRKIPFGVDLSMFHPVPKDDDKFRVICVAQMIARKGIGYLLEAMNTPRLKNVELWLIGPLQKEFKPVLDRYSGRFRYLGVLPRAELYKYYSQGSVFVLPTVEEGLALVMGQAMACGLPVIATENSGAEDLFTDGREGFIVPVRSPEAIREKILTLYDDPQRREAMSRAALERVKSYGGWESYGEKTFEVYQEALMQRAA
jgi:glycosyltransferase involved in cell wall biosynthesis